MFDRNVIKIPFWKTIESEIEKITGSQLPLYAKLLLLHYFSGCFSILGHKMLIANMLVAAKLLAEALWESLQMAKKYN